MDLVATRRWRLTDWLNNIARHETGVHVAALACILMGYCVLVFHNLGGLTLWNDEGLSFYAAVDGFRETLVRIARDTHPPLYYVLLSFWMHLGHSEFAIRSLSALAAVVALIFVYLSARALVGKNTAILAMVLFAISPANVMWAQKARPYSLQTMLVAIALWGFLRILLSGMAGERLIGGGIAATIRGDRASSSKVNVGWVAYVVGGGLAMLAQHTAGFFVLGCNVAMAVVIFRDFSRNRLLLVNWMVAQLLLSSIWLIWLPEFIGQVHEHLLPVGLARLHAGWLTTSVWSRFVEFLGVAHVWRLQLVPLLLYLAIIAVGLWAAIRNRSNVVWLYLLAGPPILVALLAYYLVNPMFGHVIFVLHWFTVPYSILVADGVAAIRFRSVQAAVLLLLLAFNAKGLINYYDESTDRVDLIAQFIAENAKPGDGIVFSHSDAERWGVAYYLPTAWKQMPGLDTSIPGDDIIQNVASATKNPRNWVVVPDDDTPAVTFAELGRTGDLAVDKRFGKIIVRRYDGQN